MYASVLKPNLVLVLFDRRSVIHRKTEHELDPTCPPTIMNSSRNCIRHQCFGRWTKIFILLHNHSGEEIGNCEYIQCWHWQNQNWTEMRQQTNHWAPEDVYATKEKKALKKPDSLENIILMDSQVRIKLITEFLSRFTEWFTDYLHLLI